MISAHLSPRETQEHSMHIHAHGEWSIKLISREHRVNACIAPSGHISGSRTTRLMLHMAGF